MKNFFLGIFIPSILIASEAASPESQGLPAAIKAIAAALAIGICGFATAYAQAQIGSSGVGAITEKPESLGKVILLMALPETVIILGFVVAALILT